MFIHREPLECSMSICPSGVNVHVSLKCERHALFPPMLQVRHRAGVLRLWREVAQQPH